MADGSVTIEVELTKEQLEKGLKSLKGDLGKLTKSSNTISNKLVKGFDNVGKASTKAGKFLTLGLTTPLTALATAGVKYNMSMETYLTNLTVLLQGNKKEAEKLLANLKEMAKTTPFETSNLVKATQTMMSFGISAKDSQKYLKQLGDISMGDANKLDSLTLAFSQVSSAGKLSGQDLLQMINAGFNPLNIISQKTGKSMATLKDEMSKGAISAKDVAQAFEWATEKGGLFYQGMEKGAQTTEGKISTLKDAFSELTGGLTEAFLPTVTKAVEKLTGLIDKFNSLDPAVKENIAKILLLVATLGPALIIFGKVASGISSIINVVSKLKTAFISGGTAVKMLSSAFTFLTSPIGIVILIIGAVIALLVLLYKKSETFRNAVNKAFEQIKNSLLKAWEKIQPCLQKLGEAFGKLLQKLAPVGEFLLNVLGKAFSKLGEILSTVVTILANVISGIIDFVANVIVFFTETIPNAWNSFVTGLQNLGTTIWNTLVNVWNSIISFFTEGIPNFINSVIQWFKELPYRIGVHIGEILGNIIKFGLDVWNWVTVELPKIIQGIIDWFAKLPENIWNWLVECFNKVVEWGKNTYNSAVEWISNTINSIISWFQQLPNRIWTWLQNTINNIVKWGIDLAEKGKQGAINLFNNIVDTIKELPQKMLDFGRNIVEGLWNGIKNAGSWIIDKVKNFAKGILDGMKSALGIHSPSALFRDEVGKYIALGVGEGFTKNIGNVYEKMKATVDFETQKLSTNLSTKATLQVSKDQPGAVTNNNGHTINNTQNFYSKESTPYEEQKQAELQLRRLTYGL